MSETRALAALVDRTKCACAAELARPELCRAAATVAQLGTSESDSIQMVRLVTERPGSRTAILRLLSGLGSAGFDNRGAALERLFLLRSALTSLAELPAVPVCSSVKAMLCDEIRAWTGADASGGDRFGAGTHRFADLCMLASLRRFPAGEFDWVRSGLPLSYLLGVSLRELPKVLLVTATGLRGRAPVFFSHFGYRRIGSSLSEAEANRAYHRMARSMAMQPEIKGLVASSWFRSPDTHRVSPRLAWVNRVVLENGGCVAVHGPADPDCGVFERSATRRRLYERGSFRPTLGLVIWPRRALLAWADSHPELAD